MVTAVFIALFLALAFGWFGRRWIAGICIAAGIFLFAAEFLWEVYSPEYGFGMPWLQGDLRLLVVPGEA